MIPKVIHYCWLSGDPIPEKLQRCLDSWKKFLLQCHSCTPAQFFVGKGRGSQILFDAFQIGV